MTPKTRIGHSLAAIAATLMLASGAAQGQATAPTAVPLESAADKILVAAYPADGPGAAAIIVRGDETVFAAGRGLADVASGRPITPDTLFRIGSITTQFTAAVILQLAAEGRLRLDDPLSRHLPGFRPPAANATIR